MKVDLSGVWKDKCSGLLVQVHGMSVKALQLPVLTSGKMTLIQGDYAKLNDAVFVAVLPKQRHALQVLDSYPIDIISGLKVFEVTAHVVQNVGSLNLAMNSIIQMCYNKET